MVSGASFPSLSDALNVNPASLPTFQTPLGIEWIGASPNAFGNSAKSNLAFTKGYKGLGAGLTSNSDRTFYSTSMASSLFQSATTSGASSYVQSGSAAPTYNLGFAYGLGDFLKKYGTTAIGINFKQNRVTNAMDPQLGITLNSRVISLGTSYATPKGTGPIPDTRLYTFDVGTRFSLVRFDYTRILTKSALYSTVSTIFTGSVQWQSLMLTAGYRAFSNATGSTTAIKMGVIQYQFSRSFVVGYYYNYIPGLQSIGLQVAL